MKTELATHPRLRFVSRLVSSRANSELQAKWHYFSAWMWHQPDADSARSSFHGMRLPKRSRNWPFSARGRLPPPAAPISSQRVGVGGEMAAAPAPQPKPSVCLGTGRCGQSGSSLLGLYIQSVEANDHSAGVACMYLKHI